MAIIAIRPGHVQYDNVINSDYACGNDESRCVQVIDADDEFRTDRTNSNRCGDDIADITVDHQALADQ